VFRFRGPQRARWLPELTARVAAGVGGESFAAFRAAYLAAALIALAGAVAAVTLTHDDDARATMARRKDPPGIG
jgi:hypothetical protein